MPSKEEIERNKAQEKALREQREAREKKWRERTPEQVAREEASWRAFDEETAEKFAQECEQGPPRLGKVRFKDEAEREAFKRQYVQSAANDRARREALRARSDDTNTCTHT